MNKIILRLIFLVSIGTILLTHFSADFRAFFNAIGNRESVLGFAWAFFFVFGNTYFLVFMFFHWGTHDFKNSKIKKVWFWTMFIGLFIGAYIYYLSVYELEKTLKSKQRNEEEK